MTSDFFTSYSAQLCQPSITEPLHFPQRRTGPFFCEMNLPQFQQCAAFFFVNSKVAWWRSEIRVNLMIILACFNVRYRNPVATTA
jgi:hypothetical protein